MANSTIYNYRFYSRTKLEVDQSDFNYLFDKLFDRQDYDRGKLTSYSVPLIFERDEQNEFVELLIEPYKNCEFLMYIDDIIETNRYDVWIRSMCDFDFIDYISLNNKSKRVCKYKYDKIVITTNEEFIARHLVLQLNLKQTENVFEYTSGGEYHSIIAMHSTDVDYQLDFSHRIALSSKLDNELVSFRKLVDCSGWYSDDKIYLFMKDLKYIKGLDKVEFVFDNRTTRIFEGEDREECIMMDDWDNCADEEFIKYKKDNNFR